MNSNLNKLINFLKEINVKLDIIDNDKNFLILFFEILNSIRFIDQKYIDQIKEKDRNLFLFFVANIKELLDKFVNYIENILPSIKSFYTQSLFNEIDNLKSEIDNLKIELFESNELHKEKEDIEKEYKRYKLLIEEKNELLKKKSIIENINIEEIKNQCNNISIKIEELNNNISELEKNKFNYKEKINQNKILENDILELKKNYETNNEFLFEKFLLLINLFQNNINDKKNFYSEQLEYSKTILKNKEEELEIFINQIKENINIYKDKLNIINNHFFSNKDIIDNLINLDTKINEKTNKLEKDLIDLEKDLSDYIKNQQDLINKIMNRNL